ncbi:hypothetical protein BHE74_00004596 [Ensete ventricosum]|nr:hypothetical protein GW17_00019156 [Ensete ventricosum]RWW86617.1 hypothetical protein BHE74_00004596 [Ensete ventricosum]
MVAYSCQEGRQRKKGIWNSYGNDRAIAFRPVPVAKDSEKEKEHIIDMRERADIVMPQPPVERVTVTPIVPRKNVVGRSPEMMNTTPTSVRSFSVGDLQQYTDSFSEENLIREDRLGKVYLAQSSDGKVCH